MVQHLPFGLKGILTTGVNQPKRTATANPHGSNLLTATGHQRRER